MDEPLPLEDVVAGRRITEADAKVVGLVPAGSIDLAPVALRLGRAMQAIKPGTVAIYCAPGGEGVGGADAPQAASQDLGSVVAHERHRAIYEVRFPPSETVVEAFDRLADAVARGRGRFSWLLVDLGAFLPAMSEALEIPEVLVTVAAAGRTREKQLRDLLGHVRSSRHLGTLLVD